MTKIILLLIFGIVNLVSYSQKDEIVLRLKEGDIKVYLIQSRENDSVFFQQVMQVGGRARRSDKIFQEGAVIYDEYHIWGSVDLKDSLFQNLYDWIKKLENFKNHPDPNNSKITIPHPSDGTGNYHLIAHKSYISFMSPYFRDQKGYDNHGMIVKMKFKTIPKFKKSLLEYTTSHNIKIRL